MQILGAIGQFSGNIFLRNICCWALLGQILIYWWQFFSESFFAAGCFFVDNRAFFTPIIWSHCYFFSLECDEYHPCQGLGEHAHFRSFGMAFLTLFRIATGDNWNGIMKDTLREECEDGDDCLRNCCVSPYFAPLFFVVFVLMAQFVLVNVVVAVLMKHLEESHKQVGGRTPTLSVDVITFLRA